MFRSKHTIYGLRGDPSIKLTTLSSKLYVYKFFSYVIKTSYYPTLHDIYTTTIRKDESRTHLVARLFKRNKDGKNIKIQRISTGFYSDYVIKYRCVTLDFVRYDKICTLYPNMLDSKLDIT